MKTNTLFLKNTLVFRFFNFQSQNNFVKQFILSCFFLFGIGAYAQWPGFQNGPGSGTFIVPANVTHVTVGAFGAGGGGGGSNSNNNGGSGGGGGGATTATYTVGAGNTFTYTIGASGAAGIATPAGAGGAGGSSTVTSALPACNMVANGGTGGGPNRGSIGLGGTASGGTNNSGANGTIGNNDGQAGGASGLGLNDATNLITLSGAGGTAPRTNQNGAGGGAPGGGGSGGENGGSGTNRTGGPGGAGRVIFNYIVVNSVTPSACIGNTITISGDYFLTGAVSVTINGTPCTSPTRVNTTTITAVVAPGTTSGQVVVTSLRGIHNGHSIVINNPPTITTQPVAPAIVCAGSGVRTMSVTATGATTYQWYKAPATLLTNGAVFSGVNTPTLTITNPALTDGGNYYVVVGNAAGCTVNSNNTALTVGSTPTVSANPANQTVIVGANTSFSATFANSPTTFIWEVSTDGGTTWSTVTNGGVYSNATTATLNLTNVPLSMNGYRYRIRSSNTCGTSANSNVAILTVVMAVPTTGNNTVTCGNNITLYDNGGAGNYANSSNGYTVLEAGVGATINISGNYVTEGSLDLIRIYSGIGTGGTLLGTYSGTGSLNYTGTPGQTLTVQFTSDGSLVYSGFNFAVTYSGVCFPVCAGAPTGGTVSVSPAAGVAGSSYTVSSTGYTAALNMLYQWQFSTNGGSTWTNAGAATSTYANYTATAPALGTVVVWQLIVTCTNSGLSATSTSATFTSVTSQIIPTTGNNTVSCGTNIVLYDNGGASANYANSSNGYTVLEAGLGATITISGNYVTESVDYIRIYSGTGTGGTLLATYSGTGSINYTGAAGQTLTVQFTSDGSIVYSGFNLSVSYSGVCFPVCAGAPTGGTVSVSPATGVAGSSYTVSSTGYTAATNMLYQWQFSTNGGSTWTNAGAATSTYTNYTATAPALGTVVVWQLVVTCTNSGLSATSSSATFTSVTSQIIPTTGNNTVSCGTNIVLYDNGGASADYANSSNGYTVLEAGLGATITISGNYVTEGVDYIRIYSGTGTGGTLLATYSGTGSINYTGAAGQTLTVQFTSDGSVVYAGFTLSVSYSGVCFPVCAGTPTGGTISTSPNTGWPGSTYSVVATGYTQALNMLYQWQYSTNAGATWTNAGAATSTYANYTGAIAPASGLVHWQLVATCTNSGQSATSTPGIFTVMTVSGVVTGCPNVVSGGLGLSGADPAAVNCTAATTCVDLEATYLDLGDTTDYIVEPIVYNPPFAFNGLANPVSVNTDDVWSPVVPLPFDFCFYGNTFNQCLIGSNGVITFDTTNNTPGGYCGWSTYSPGANLPISGHSALIENAIFGVFHDINPANGGNVGWELVTLPSGCRALVVAWSNVPMFSNDTANDYTGMMVLYENSNIIEVYVKKKNVTTHPGFGAEPMWNDGNAVIGIQNATGTLASVPPGRNVLDPNWTATNEAWRFVPNGTSIASIAWYEGSGTTGPIVGTTPNINVCPTSTTTYTAEITYTLCDGRTIKEMDETTVTINGAKLWDGSVNTNWNNANNWTPVGVPTSADCVVIPNTANDPIVSGTNYDALGLNLTIENGAILTVNATNDLIINDWVNINAGGDLQVNNSASLIQVNNNSNSGTMHMARTVSMRRLDYVYWSSPVTSFASSAISPLTPTSYIYKWAPTLGYTVNNHGSWLSGNENMVVGKGYIVRGPNTFTTTLAPFTATFTGTPNNGIITTPISRGVWNSGSYATGLSTTLATEHDDNWNLIGNPYPSAVNAISFLTANTNIDGFIKIWTHGTLPDNAIPDHFYDDHVYNYSPGDYITYNSAGTSSGPGVFGGYIAAGQGFFVAMLHTSAGTNETVTFNNSMRGTTNSNSQFFRNTNQVNSENDGRIWLDLINSSSTAVRNLVGYFEGASNNRDRLFDAMTDEKLDFNLYSKIGDDTMVIQGRALPFDQNDKVSIGYKIPQDGTYSIGIGAIDGFFTNTNQNIYLEDKVTNIIHDLRQSPYNFTSVAGNYDNRFVLRYTNETLGGDDLTVDEANLWVISSDVLSVKSTKNEIQSVRVFDVLGRQLAYYPNVEGYEVPLNTIQKNNAGLIIQVTLSNGTVVSKKTIY